jgi:uncharacterized protein
MTMLKRSAVRLALLLLVAAIILAPVRIPYRVLIVAAGALALTWVECGSLAPLGLKRHGWRATLGWALALALFAAGLIGEVVQPLIERALDQPADYSSYGSLAGNLPAALRLACFAWLSAALGEEIVFRGFMLRQLEALLRRSRVVAVTSVVLAAAVFGAAHWKQGPSGIIASGIIGLVFGWAWFRSGRNLPALILAHGLADTYGVAGLYFGRWG